MQCVHGVVDSKKTKHGPVLHHTSNLFGIFSMLSFTHYLNPQFHNVDISVWCFALWFLKKISSKAIESLHAEVHRLREHLERTLRTARPSHRVRAPLSPSKDIRDRTPPHTSTPHPQQRDVRYLSSETLYPAPEVFHVAYYLARYLKQSCDTEQGSCVVYILVTDSCLVKEIVFCNFLIGNFWIVLSPIVACLVPECLQQVITEPCPAKIEKRSILWCVVKTGIEMCCYCSIMIIMN